MSLDEFDAASEATRLIALAEYDREQAQCGHCGRPREVCSDPERKFYPQRSICYATRDRIVAERKFHMLHKGREYHDGTETFWRAEPDAMHLHKYDDGVTIWTADVDLAPDDTFLNDRDGGD